MFRTWGSPASVFVSHLFCTSKLAILGFPGRATQCIFVFIVFREWGAGLYPHSRNTTNTNTTHCPGTPDIESFEVQNKRDTNTLAGGPRVRNKVRTMLKVGLRCTLDSGMFLWVYFRFAFHGVPLVYFQTYVLQCSPRFA